MNVTGNFENEMIEVKYPEVNREDMVALYKKCLKMLKLQPWRDMLDFHVVAIVDPDSEKKQLAVIMGNARQVFALHLYQPEEGTRFFTKIQIQGTSPQLQHDAQYDQKMLSIEFVPQNTLGDHDQKLIDEFGSQEWSSLKENSDMGFVPVALLSSTIPGSPSWHINELENKKLLDAVSLMERFHTKEFEEYEWATFSPEVTNGEVQIKLPTYRLPSEANRDDASAWGISMEEFVAPSPKLVPEAPQDDLFAIRLEKYPVKPSEVWEIGAAFLPSPIMRENYPYYGVMGLVAVQSSRFAAGNQLVLSSECRYTLMRRVLESAAEQLGYLPHKIIVGSPIAEKALAQISKNVSIVPAHNPDQMTALNEVMTSIMEPMPSEGDLLDMASEFGDDEVQLLNSLILKIGELDPNDEASTDLLYQQIDSIPGASQMIEKIMQSNQSWE